MSEDTTDIGKDEIFEALSNSRRRQLIYRLHQRTGEADLRELAREIAAVENGIPVEEVDDDQFKRLYISLYQTHVPKLESYGMVEYDADEKEVVLVEGAEQLAQVLGEDGDARPWWQYYGGLAVASAALLVVHQLVLFPGVPVIAVAAVTVVLLVALVLFHYYDVRKRRTRDSIFEHLVR